MTAKSTIQLPAASGFVVKGCGVLAGWNFAETGAVNPVVIRLYDIGTGTPTPGTSPLLAVCHLLAGETAGDSCERIYLNGIYALISGTGTAEGVVDA